MIIGVTGKRRAGKDTVAAHLREKYAFTRVAFADPVRELAYAINPTVEFNKSYHDIQYVVDTLGWEDAKSVPGVRVTLQRVGHEAREVLGNTVWIDKAMREAARFKKVAISDTRYPNEAQIIRANGGRIIKVVRPSTEKREFDSHPSETGVDLINADFTIVNDGSKEDLLAAVDGLVTSWGLSTP